DPVPIPASLASMARYTAIRTLVIRITYLEALFMSSSISLAPDQCRRARLARDARFDGRFFVAVVTTGIYCRPICPARAPLERNVRYFDTAFAAAEAGFRPCLRCRPDSAPGSPAWRGTDTT